MRDRKRGISRRYAPIFHDHLLRGFDLQSNEDKLTDCSAASVTKVSVFVKVFAGNIVFRHFVGVNFLPFMIVCSSGRPIPRRPRMRSLLPVARPHFPNQHVRGQIVPANLPIALPGNLVPGL